MSRTKAMAINVPSNSAFYNGVVKLYLSFEYFIIEVLPPFYLSTSSGPCDAGYICFYNATRPTPTFELGVLEWGRLCSAGSYCPSGTTHERECPEGTYR